MMIHKTFTLFAIFITLWCMNLPANAQPVITDSRIKTLVYNENDVYTLLTHHGYQAHIEFGGKEVIQTISIGNKTAWQIIPEGRRLFIRSLVAGAHTNMAVITNLRTYQFDVRATRGGNIPVREDLIYMVRFYYPDEHLPKSAAYALPPVYADDMMKAIPVSPKNPQPTALPALNFNYTFTGDDEFAPLRMFDDGKATYIQLPQPAKLFTISVDGRETPVTTRRTSDGFEKVSLVAPRFIIRYPDGDVQVYNESMLGGK